MLSQVWHMLIPVISASFALPWCYFLSQRLLSQPLTYLLLFILKKIQLKTPIFQGSICWRVSLFRGVSPSWHGQGRPLFGVTSLRADLKWQQEWLLQDLQKELCTHPWGWDDWAQKIKLPSSQTRLNLLKHLDNRVSTQRQIIKRFFIHRGLLCKKQISTLSHRLSFRFLDRFQKYL